MKWTIEHDNDTGPNDESYHEWWMISNGDKSFKCTDEADAKWLCAALNVYEAHEECLKAAERLCVEIAKQRTPIIPQ